MLILKHDEIYMRFALFNEILCPPQNITVTDPDLKCFHLFCELYEKFVQANILTTFIHALFKVHLLSIV